MNLHKYFANKLFMKMLLYFSTMLIPVVVIGIIFYSYSIQEARKDFGQNVAKSLEFSKERIEHSVQMAVDTSLSLIMETSFQEPVIQAPKMTTEQKKNFESMIQAIRKSQNFSNYFIDNLFVFKDDQWILRNDGAENFEMFFRDLYHFEKYPVPFWKTYLSRPSAVQYLSPTLIRTSNGNTKTVIPTVTVEQNPTGNLAVVVCISTEAIEETIRLNMIFPETDFMILDPNNKVIVSSQNDLWNHETVDTFKTLNYPKAPELAPLKWQGRSYLVSSIVSDQLGWTYYTITPNRYFRIKANNILKVTVLTSLILFLFGIGLSVLFSVKLYSPIRNIREILIENNEKIASSGRKLIKQGEFEIIHSALHDLFTENSTYSNRMHEISDEYLDNAFKQLVRGHKLDHINEFTRMIREDLNFSSNHYVCCSIAFDFSERFYSKIQDPGRTELLAGIKIVLRDTIASQNKLYLLELEPCLFVGIVNLDEDNSHSKLLETLELIHHSFSYELSLYRICIGVGKVHSDLSSLWLSHSEAQHALEFSFSSSQSGIADASHLEIKPVQIYALKDEEKLMNCLRARDEAGLSTILDVLIGKTESVANLNFNRQMLFNELHRTGARFAAEQGIDFFGALNQDQQRVYKNINDLNRDTDVNKDALLGMFRTLTELSGPPPERSGQLIQNVLNFIEAHYQEDIHPEQIAGEVGISVKYLSKLFKAQTNLNLTDYISEKRILKAKELLITTSLTIEEIYPKVGIQSRVTFYRLFKKHVGTNPGNFRKVAEEGSCNHV